MHCVYSHGFSLSRTNAVYPILLSTLTYIYNDYVVSIKTISKLIMLILIEDIFDILDLKPNDLRKYYSVSSFEKVKQYYEIIESLELESNSAAERIGINCTNVYLFQKPSHI